MTIINNDTIIALATAPLSAGVAVLRLSGKESLTALHSIAPKLKEIKPRYAHYTTLQVDGETLDKVVVIYFKSPNSFTGEDVVEIHCHGGLAVVESIIQALLKVANIRSAEAGEFSRRAVINGKMDITEAEGIADLIAATTTSQRKQALRQMEGELGRKFDAWRKQIMHLLAHIEAAIDFPDEEIEVLEQAGLKEKTEKLLLELEQASNSRLGERVRDGFQLAIVGKPNVGKSTLVNLLTGRETAIVSPIAGTTRDVVEAHIDIGGFPVIIADTAGIRDTSDIIEAEGVKRAKQRSEKADITIIVINAEDWAVNQSEIISSVSQGIIVVSKVDKTNLKLPQKLGKIPVVGLNLTCPMSSDKLVKVLTVLIQQSFAGVGEAVNITRERHRSAITTAIEHLRRGLGLYATLTDTSLSDLLAQDYRDAATEIGKVTGRTTSEDVLDLVFSSFCIGK